MAAKRTPVPPQPFGETLRRRRVDGMRKGLCETARLLSIAPPHLTDIEKGRRTPSEDLMLRIATVYGIPEAELRSGWGRAESDAVDLMTSTPTNAEKAPAFLRAAGELSSAEWDILIRQAEKLSASKRRGGSS